MIKILCLGVVLCWVTGCAVTGLQQKPQQKLQQAEVAKAEDLQTLVSIINRQSSISELALQFFNEQIEKEGQAWRAKLPKQLTGQNLIKGQAELTDFKQRMQQKSLVMADEQAVNERLKKYVSLTFTPEEIKQLAQLLASPAWLKFDDFNRKLVLSPDSLLLAQDFSAILRTERQAMTKRLQTLKNP